LSGQAACKYLCNSFAQSSLDSSQPPRFLEFERPRAESLASGFRDGPVRLTGDGKGVVYPVRDRETDNLWIQNLEGSPGKQLTDFKKSEGARRGKGRAWREAFKVSGGIGNPRWSPNGKGLQYLLIRDKATNIWEQPLAGGEPKQITRFTSGHMFDFNWSSDSMRLVMTRGSISSNVVLLQSLR
jgi:hypothetical protein